MVIMANTCIQHCSALNRIFSDMEAGPTPMAPLYNVRDVIPAGHVPVKRMASGPSSEFVRALPKRRRAMATSSPYVIGSPDKVIGTPVQDKRFTSANRKGLSLAPVNRSRNTVLPNCCLKENMCFGALTSSVPVSTPPYGSLNVHFPATGGTKVIRRKLRKSRRKRSPNKAQVILNQNTDENHEAKRKESLGSQPNALVVYNSFLRQLEKNPNHHQKSSNKREQLNQSTGYSRGFTPTMTSTPHHKTTSVTSQTSSKAPLTSGYHSASRRSSEFNDSFDAFLKFIEEGALALNKKELQSPCPRHNSEQNEDSNAKIDFGSAATSSGIGSLSDHRSSSREQSELPKMFPIGAPLAASSPLSNPASASSGAFEHGSSVWRPWC